MAHLCNDSLPWRITKEPNIQQDAEPLIPPCIAAGKNKHQAEDFAAFPLGDSKVLNMIL